MIRQLDTIEGFFTSPDAEEAYRAEKAARLEAKQAEPIEEDLTVEHHWARMGWRLNEIPTVIDEDDIRSFVGNHDLSQNGAHLGERDDSERPFHTETPAPRGHHGGVHLKFFMNMDTRQVRDEIIKSRTAPEWMREDARRIQ